ncbi:VSP [Giardia duodenalis]|uniref:VSP n=1 Tax=Giardia intestinalis (strain ATCC 50803 / WB clone C6) TaxID=184922 RepID=A0A644EYQ0_GIAIC|nr:VSP [Giardia intestinalis]KAE8301282.1 VSP [Giardia intestinalis]
MFQLIPLFMASALMAPCQPDGNHLTTCAHEKCETVGSAEICTECKVGGVPVDGFCRPFGSIQAAAAGCTKADGAALDKMTATCEKCGDGYFLFMGGCYKTSLWSEVCTAASNGVCTTCNTKNGLFKNPAATVTPGNECILCSDATDRNGVMGVENCLKCTAPGGNTGAAACTACKAGFYGSGPCTKCHDDCATCSGAANNQCTSCKAGKYLKTDTNTCVDAGSCNGNTYADPVTRTCKDSAITDCTTCEYNPATGGPKCTACGNSKKVKTAIDGATTCVTVASECVDENHFKDDGNTMCVLCSDTSGSDPNKGVAQCKTCTKNGANKPECKTCLEGYVLKGSGADAICESCGNNCAVCTAANDISTCTGCLPGYFLKAEGGTKECVPCDDTAKGGREGCSLCSSNGGFKCTDCKANYRKQSNGDAGDDYTCVKTCEDPTVCGGTSGACDAIVIDANGKEHYYCSYCGETNKFPIDGLCTDNKGTNAGCTDHTCSYCAAGFFLYMGGCYKIDTVPGSYMCSKSTTAGVCDTPNANNRFFVVPKAISAEQSVLACGNPLGTIAGGNAYVGVEGCSQCTAPDARADGGMAVATCTACEDGKKPGKSGTGCVACPDANCKSCTMDDVCEECADGFSLDNGKCVSSGTNKSGLSTGAIAGISVAAIVVVGGLVGFLCWWFICRGKA